ncbi:MAG: thermonuclease family protein [Carbonactinosporaceae bacterium]
MLTWLQAASRSRGVEVRALSRCRYALAAALLVGGCGMARHHDAAEPPPAGVPETAQLVVVSRTVDGDTLDVRALESGPVFGSDSHASVRLLEVDTPETKHPTVGVECFGPQAARFLQRWLPAGAKVWAAPDEERSDRYGRDLLYLWTRDGTFVNREIVRRGFGEAVLYEPNDRYIDAMRAAEVRASAAGRGLWGACRDAGEQPEQPEQPAQPARRERDPGAPAGTDPRLGTCAEAIDGGYGPYHEGRDPEYAWYTDGDGDGTACEP